MRREMHELIHKLLDGVITPGEFGVLQDAMRQDPAVRDLYYEYAAMEQRMQFQLGRQASQAGVAGLAQLRLARQRKRTIKVAAMTALAASILLAIGLSFFFIQRPENDLQFAYAPGTKYTITHDTSAGDVRDGKMREGSRMVVSQGTVELKFESGVRAVLSAPADITLLEGGMLSMPEGRGWFDVPKEAVGFTVHTKEVSVVDLGTTFGVYAHEIEGDQVHVFEGKVEVSANAGAKGVLSLGAGDAVEAGSRGELVSVHNNDEMFLTALPKALPHVHFSFDDKSDFVSSCSLTGKPEFGYAYHGASAEMREGVFGAALHLNGEDNYVEADWEGVLGDKPRSVIFWFKMPETRLERDVKQFSDTIVGWGMQRSGSTMENKFNNKWTVHLDYAHERYPMLNISFGGFWYYFPGVVLDDDRWHHVAVIYTGKSDEQGLPVIKLYLDGTAVPITDDNVTRDSRHMDADGRVMVNTLEKSPMGLGASLAREEGQHYRKANFLRASIDELYVIEGEVDEETVLSLMEENVFPGGGKAAE